MNNITEELKKKIEEEVKRQMKQCADVENKLNSKIDKCINALDQNKKRNEKTDLEIAWNKKECDRNIANLYEELLKLHGNEELISQREKIEKEMERNKEELDRKIADLQEELRIMGENGGRSSKRKEEWKETEENIFSEIERIDFRIDNVVKALTGEEEVDDEIREIEQIVKERRKLEEKLERKIKEQEEEIGKEKQCRNQQIEGIENKVAELAEQLEEQKNELGKEREKRKWQTVLGIDKEVQDLKRKQFEDREEILEMKNMEKLKEIKNKQEKKKNEEIELNGKQEGISMEIESLKNKQKDLEIKVEKNAKNIERCENKTKQEIQKVKKRMEAQKERLDKAKTVEQPQSITTAEINQEIRELQQQKRNCNAELWNVPEENDENLREIVRRVAKVKGIQVEDKEIESMYRYKTRGTANHRPIRIHFSNKTTRDNFIKRESKEMVFQDQIVEAGSKSEKVLIYEELCPYYKNLRYLTKKWANENEFKFVWYKNYKIFLRRNEVEKVVHTIGSEEELRTLKKKLSDTEETDNSQEETDDSSEETDSSPEETDN